LSEESDDLKDQFDFVTGHVKRMTWGSRIALLGVASSLCGTLYAGFLMYQKVEAIASLDLDAYAQQMEVMDAKVEEAVDYARDIKNGLKDDIIRIEKQVDRTEDTVRASEDKVRDMIDKAGERFESSREQLRTSQRADLKELEDKLTKRLQEALDNPLSQ
jgi:septal ring factor EnvC (AmiA/AmiB activator)